MHNSPRAKHSCLLWVTELLRWVLVTESRGGSIWSPRDEREKTAMVERSTIEQWCSILQFDPTVSQYIIIIHREWRVVAKQYYGVQFFCCFIFIPRSELAAFHQHRRRMCVLPRRELWQSMGRMYFVETSIRKMRRVGVKRFHGVQRHSRRRPAAQMAAEIEKRQKKK